MNDVMAMVEESAKSLATFLFVIIVVVGVFGIKMGLYMYV